MIKRHYYLFFITITLLTLVFTTNNVFSQAKYKTKTFKLNKTDSLTINVADTWRILNKADYVFVNKNAKDNLEITLAKGVANYNCDEKKFEIMNLHREDMMKKLKVKPAEIQEGVDDIEGIQVPWFMVLTDQKHSAKMLYPAINGKLYIIAAAFSKDAPFNDAEKLISEIVKAIKQQSE